MTNTIPAEMIEADRWVVWKYEQRDGKPTKVPYNARTGKKAKSDDSATWTNYRQALDSVELWDAEGIGFVFGGGWMGADFDHVISDAGTLEPWAAKGIERLDSYTEVSPSGEGLKVFCLGSFDAGTKRDPETGTTVPKTGGKCGPQNRFEAYHRERFFTVTGRTWDGSPATVNERSDVMQAMWNEMKGFRENEKAEKRTSKNGAVNHTVQDQTGTFPKSAPHDSDIIAKARRAKNGARFETLWGGGNDDLPSASEADQALCNTLAFWCGKEPSAIDRLFRQSGRMRDKWLRDDYRNPTIQNAIESCRECYDWNRNNGHANTWGNSPGEKKGPRLSARSVNQIVSEFPALRPPLVHGLLRRGETMNIIAQSKMGKTWLVSGLEYCIASGRKWLDRFQCEQGNVLVIDNELHAETTSHRMPCIAEAMNLPLADVGERLFVDNVRGQSIDIGSLGSFLADVEPGQFSVIVLDAWYRFQTGVSENDNREMAAAYNTLDRLASRLQCSFILIHHGSKGSQAGKAVVDVGAGAGAQSRAADTHLVLREHKEPGCIVLDAAVRSWKPIEPFCLRWDFPLWLPDLTLDPADLKPERPRRQTAIAKIPVDPEPPWNASRFVAEFVSSKPAARSTIVERALEAGLSGRKAEALMQSAEDDELVYRWEPKNRNQPVKFATTPPPQVPNG